MNTTFHTLKIPQYPPYSQDHQDYPYYSNHYENEEYMMRPYEEENTEDMKNKILAMIEELEQEMTHIREGWKQEFRQRTSSLGKETQASIRTLEDQMAQVAKCGNEEEDTHDMTSENNCIIEDVDNEVNLFNPCVFNDRDSFDSSDDDDENCFDTCENNSFVSLDDNDGLESFTFDDNALSNENVDDLHDMLFDDMNVDASLAAMTLPPESKDTEDAINPQLAYHRNPPLNSAATLHCCCSKHAGRGSPPLMSAGGSSRGRER
nr:uncharacterized protein LOC109169483 [Ipomoea batatas]